MNNYYSQPLTIDNIDNFIVQKLSEIGSKDKPLQNPIGNDFLTDYIQPLLQTKNILNIDDFLLEGVVITEFSQSPLEINSFPTWFTTEKTQLSPYKTIIIPLEGFTEKTKLICCKQRSIVPFNPNIIWEQDKGKYLTFGFPLLEFTDINGNPLPEIKNTTIDSTWIKKNFPNVPTQWFTGLDIEKEISLERNKGIVIDTAQINGFSYFSDRKIYAKIRIWERGTLNRKFKEIIVDYKCKYNKTENKTSIIKNIDFLKFDANFIKEKYAIEYNPVIEDKENLEYQDSNRHYTIDNAQLLHDHLADFKELFKKLGYPSLSKFYWTLKHVREGAHPPHTDSDNHYGDHYKVFTRANLACDDGSPTVYFNKNMPDSGFYIKKTHNLFHDVEQNKIVKIDKLIDVDSGNFTDVNENLDLCLDLVGDKWQLSGLQISHVLDFKKGKMHIFPVSNLHGSYRHENVAYKWMLTGVIYI